MAENAKWTKLLIATVGLPRSGKTTWALQQNIPIVNPDSIRLAIHGERFIAKAEPFIWAVAHAMVDALFLAGHDRIILDATNTTRKRRDEWKSKNFGTVFKIFDTSKEECIKRAEKIGDEVIKPIIEKMAAQFEPLEIDEIIFMKN